MATACGSNSDWNRDLMVHCRALAVDRLRMAEQYAREAVAMDVITGHGTPLYLD